MALVQATKTHDTSGALNETINILFEKLDEAIVDLEHGRVQTIDEAWEEIDAI